MAQKSFLAASAAVCLLAIGAGGCTPTVAYNGFQAREEQPQAVQVGLDTKTSVTERLGSPSMTSTFEPNVWFYISQTTSKVAFRNPKLMTREVVEIVFADDDKVQSVKTYGLKDGYQVAIAKGETPTRGREMTILEQLLGNVGRGNMIPPDLDPGQRPGGR